MNSINYLNSVDSYFNYYVTTLSSQINLINNNLSTYGSVNSLMNNITYLNTYSVSLSGIVNNNYYYQGSLNRTSLSYIVNNNYYNQGALNNYNILHRTTLSYMSLMCIIIMVN